MTCANPHCPNEVPPGWEGGYCEDCCLAMVQAEEARFEQLLLEEQQEREDDTFSPTELEDPHEEFGWDYYWEE